MVSLGVEWFPLELNGFLCIVVLQLRTAFSRLTTLQPCVCGFQYQQVRHKKGTGRYKAPTVGKDKDKWVPRLRK